MSFEPIKFIYNPPRTIEAPLPEASSYVPNTTTNNPNVYPVSTATNAATSFAVSLISRYNGLAATSSYLQQVILQQTQDTPITIDFDVDPDASRAMIGLFGTPNPSNTVTVKTYSQMLDSQLGATMADMQLGSNSPFVTSPYQNANILTLTQSIEQNLQSQGTYSSILPTMLRNLKGDQVIFQSIAQTLQSYPVVQYDQYQASQLANPSTNTSIIPASSLDVSPPLNSYLNDYADRYSTAYAGTYQLVSGINAVEGDINNVLSQYFNTAISELNMITSLLSAAQTLTSLTRLQDMADDLLGFAFVRLQCEAFTFMSLFNRLMNITVIPFQQANGILHKLSSAISGIASKLGTQTVGGLKGMIQGSSCSTRSNSSVYAQVRGLQIPGLHNVTAGLASLGSHLAWAESEVMKGEEELMKQFRRLCERRINASGDMLELMCSLKSIQTLVSFGKAIASQPQSLAPTQQTQPSTITNILSNISVGTGTTYSVSNGSVIASPPNVPPIPPTVASVFATGGLKQLNLSS